MGRTALLLQSSLPHSPVTPTPAVRHCPSQGGAAPGDFDAGGAASRHVVRDIDTKQFLMFYEGVGLEGQRSVGLAVSRVGGWVAGWLGGCIRPGQHGAGRGRQRWDLLQLLACWGRGSGVMSRGARANCLARHSSVPAALQLPSAWQAGRKAGRKAAAGGHGVGHAAPACHPLQDGLTGWKRYQSPVLVPSTDAGAWDCGAVGTPCAVSMKEGRWRLYYAGRGARWVAGRAADPS